MPITVFELVAVDRAQEGVAEHQGRESLHDFGPRIVGVGNPCLAGFGHQFLAAGDGHRVRLGGGRHGSGRRRFGDGVLARDQVGEGILAVGIGGRGGIHGIAQPVGPGQRDQHARQSRIGVIGAVAVQVLELVSVNRAQERVAEHQGREGLDDFGARIAGRDLAWPASATNSWRLSTVTVYVSAVVGTEPAGGVSVRCTRRASNP